MSAELTPHRSAPQHYRHWPWLGAGIAVVLVVAVVVLLTRGPGHTSAVSSRRGRAAAESPSSSPSGAAGRTVAITALLAARARAIVDGDRSALLATIDPTRRRFAAAQVRMLANLRAVPLSSWSYTVHPGVTPGSSAATAGYRVSTYTPVVSLHYRVKGFDTTATDLSQYPTFTHRGGRWYLASLRDFAAQGRISATDLWDYGPVDVVRRPGVIVLGAPSMLVTMHQVAVNLQAAIPRVTSVWGRHWSRRVVAEVPQTQRELGLVTGDTGDLAKLAALTSAEVQASAGHPAPVGARISVNPSTWPSLGVVGRLVVLTHELTHVASRADTGSQTPRWLQEGFADYVGFRGTGVPAPVVARELTAAVRGGLVPRRLPSNHEFAGSAPRLAQSYEEGWLACRLIAARAGQAALVRFYRQVGTATTGSSQAVGQALQRVLHLSTGQFTELWRRYVRAQLT